VNVWVVSRGRDWEGSYVVAVTATREEAAARAEAHYEAPLTWQQWDDEQGEARLPESSPTGTGSYRVEVWPVE